MARTKPKRGRTVLLVVVLGFIIYFSVSFFNEWSNLTRLEENKAQMRAELETIENENENLKEVIDFSATPDFIERMAREIFGMIKEGETIYVDENQD